MAQYRIEPSEQAEFGPCACCGGITRRVWGYVHYGDAALAAYFVSWTEGRIAKHGAQWDFIVGSWGGEAKADDRVAVALEMRATEHGPEFMVIDAGSRDIGAAEVAAKSMSREDVIGTKLADAVFGMVDAIWIGDERIAELAGG